MRACVRVAQPVICGGLASSQDRRGNDLRSHRGLQVGEEGRGEAKGLRITDLSGAVMDYYDCGEVD